MSSESIHTLIIYTDNKRPLLEGPLKPLVERALLNIKAHHPGIQILQYAVCPNRVEMTLDLQRLDEDLARIVQLFKAEAKSQAKTTGFAEENFWQWGFEEK